MPHKVMDVEKIKKLPEQLKAAGMANVDILINNAGLALGVASAIESPGMHPAGKAEFLRVEMALK